MRASAWLTIKRRRLNRASALPKVTGILFELDLSHVCCLESLGTLRDLEFDLIALGQRLKSLALDR